MDTEVGGKQADSLLGSKVIHGGQAGIGGFSFSQQQGLRGALSCKCWGREVSELPWDKSRDMRCGGKGNGPQSRDLGSERSIIQRHWIMVEWV